MKVHHVFHILFLEPYIALYIPGRNQPPLPLIEVDGNKEYEVEEILDSKFVCEKLFYFVHWCRYAISG